MTVWLLSIYKFNHSEFVEFLKKHRDKIFFSSSRYFGYIGSEQLSVNYKKYKNKKSRLVSFEEKNLDITKEEIKKISITTNKITCNGEYIEEPNYLGVFSIRGLTISKYYNNSITDNCLEKLCYSIYEDIYNKK